MQQHSPAEQQCRLIQVAQLQQHQGCSSVVAANAGQPAGAPEAELWRAEEPFWLCRSTSQPAATRCCTTAAWPLSAAAGRRAGEWAARPHARAKTAALLERKCTLMASTIACPPARLPHPTPPNHPPSSPRHKTTPGLPPTHLRAAGCSRWLSLCRDRRPAPAAAPRRRQSRCWRRCRGGCSRWWWARPLQGAGRGRQLGAETASQSVVCNHTWFCPVQQTKSALAEAGWLAGGISRPAWQPALACGPLLSKLPHHCQVALAAGVVEGR